LDASEGMTIDIINMGLVKVFATSSGDRVTYIGNK